MSKLIGIEIKKLLHKKGIYVIWGLMFIILLLNNILYWKDYDEEGRYKYAKKDNLVQEKESIEKELKKYDYRKDSDKTMYLSLKTKYDLLLLKEKYDIHSWQYNKINDYLMDSLYQINYYTYIEVNSSVLESLKKEKIQELERLNHDDWKYFVLKEKEQLEEESKLKLNEIETSQDKHTISLLKTELSLVDTQLKVLNYRLQFDVKEDDGYLNEALTKYFSALEKITDMEKIKNKTLEEKLEYNRVKEEMYINQYIFKNKENINKENTMNYSLRTIVEDYEIFFVILILMISSLIICEEFHTGTIKLLLIKPVTRGKILLGKYFASGFMILVSIILLVGLQMIVGGLLFGFDSLSVPVIQYNHNTSKIVEYSIFWYMLIRIFCRLPFFIMLAIICFGIGVVFTNTVIAIMIPLILYMFSPAIHELAVLYQIDFLKYSITMNWDFQNYLFGGLSDFGGIDCKFSILIWSVYFVIVLFITIVSFKKKNIRNI